MIHVTRWGVFAVLALGMAGMPALAQQGGDGNAPPAPPQLGATPPQPRADAGQGVINRAKQQLGMTDTQFQALEPKLQTVLQLQRSLNTGGPGQGGPGQGGPGMGGRGPGGPGGFGQGGFGGPGGGFGGGGGGPGGFGGPGGGGFGGPDGGGGPPAGGASDATGGANQAQAGAAGAAPPAGGGAATGNVAQPDPGQSTVQVALRALRAAIANPESTAEDLKAKIDAYRAARTKAKTELADAQKALRDGLDAHQQAVLIALGILE